MFLNSNCQESLLNSDSGSNFIAFEKNSHRNKEEEANCQFLTDFLLDNREHRIDGDQKWSKLRQTANVRERKRMKSINYAFESLRARVPSLHYGKKLSKADTLKLAIGYIGYLSEIVSDKNDQNEKQNEEYSAILDQNKVFIHCHQNSVGSNPLVGYSLSWTDERNKTRRNKIVTTIWTPKNLMK